MNATFLRAAFAGVLLLAASGIAQSADLSRGERTYAPVAQGVSLYNWTGLYAGANVGGDWVRDSASWGFFGSDLNSATVFGGLQAGYNYQTGPWVFGLEADAGYGNASKTVGLGLLDLKTEKTWSGTARLRAGYAFDTVLVYGTGGLAWASFKSTLTDVFGNSASDDKTRIGWTVGGGLEYGMTKNISIKGEYLYSDYGGTTTVLGVREEISDHLVRVGLNYRF